MRRISCWWLSVSRSSQDRGEHRCNPFNGRTRQGTRRTQFETLMAGNVIATLPLILGFVLAQRWFVASMTFSGLKR
jgi:ABC-type glycerol-3-phosphate transport system permease component